MRSQCCECIIGVMCEKDFVLVNSLAAGFSILNLEQSHSSTVQTSKQGIAFIKPGEYKSMSNFLWYQVKDMISFWRYSSADNMTGFISLYFASGSSHSQKITLAEVMSGLRGPRSGCIWWICLQSRWSGPLFCEFYILKSYGMSSLSHHHPLNSYVVYYLNCSKGKPMPLLLNSAPCGHNWHSKVSFTPIISLMSSLHKLLVIQTM